MMKDSTESNRELIASLAYNVSLQMKTCSSISHERVWRYKKWDGPYPLCQLADSEHVIWLTASEDAWCQWIYQFAHEYCHHLIDGPMTGGLKGLNWFEEVLCHTASLFCLERLADFSLWNQLGETRFLLSVRKYLDNSLLDSYALRDQYDRWNSDGNLEGIRPWLDILEETASPGKEKYPRTIYNAVASLILPVFLRTPSLWMILAHIGDSAQWPDLGTLFSYLQSAMPVDLAPALGELRYTLLPD